MRKVDDGEEKKKEKIKKIMTFIVATNAIASRPLVPINLVETKSYSNGIFSKMLDYITIEYLLYSLMLYLHCFTSGDKKNI